MFQMQFHTVDRFPNFCIHSICGEFRIGLAVVKVETFYCHTFKCLVFRF